MALRLEAERAAQLAGEERALYTLASAAAALSPKPELLVRWISVCHASLGCENVFTSAVTSSALPSHPAGQAYAMASQAQSLLDIVARTSSRVSLAAGSQPGSPHPASPANPYGFTISGSAGTTSQHHDQLTSQGSFRAPDWSAPHA